MFNWLSSELKQLKAYSHNIEEALANINEMKDGAELTQCINEDCFKILCNYTIDLNVIIDKMTPLWSPVLMLPHSVFSKTFLTPLMGK